MCHKQLKFLLVFFCFCSFLYGQDLNVDGVVKSITDDEPLIGVSVSVIDFTTPSTFHPWYKATTQNFVKYTDDGEMIPTGADKSQEDALGTGGIIKYNNKYYAFYTAHNADLDPKEKIYLAISSDLNTWEKQPSFSFQAPDGYDRNEFRDPIVLENNGSFTMILSTRADVGGGAWKGVLAQFKSTDLLNWSVDTEHPFLYIDDSEFMVECPDVFTQGVYEYIIFSGINSRKVHYKYRKIGVTAWTTPSSNILDGLAFYAGKTASDGTNRYLFGWVPTRKDYNDESDFIWGGSLVVHQITQNEDGTINVLINNDISKNITTQHELKVLENTASISSAEGSYSMTEGQSVIFDRLSGVSKIETSIKAETATKFGFKFAVAGNQREVFYLEFDTKKQSLVQYKELRLNNEKIEQNAVFLPKSGDNTYKVKLLIENSICILYVNDKIAFTNRIYWMNQNPWSIYSGDGIVKFDNLKMYK